jgi:hypothetical protein
MPVKSGYCGLKLDLSTCPDISPSENPPSISKYLDNVYLSVIESRLFIIFAIDMASSQLRIGFVFFSKM